MPKRKPVRSSPVLKEPSAPYGGEIVLYRAPDGSVKLDVRLEKETIWLNLNQMAALFERDKSFISRHLRNIYKEGELEQEATVAFFATTAADGKTYNVEYFNLDAIISVGYRVNSKRGTQFRIWATQVLRNHILRGYTVNARRLQELQQTIRLVSTLADQHALSSDEAAGLLRVVRDYAFALDLIDDYDHGRVPQPEIEAQAAVPLLLEEARRIIAEMKKHYGGGGLFGQEQGERLADALAAIYQSAGGQDCVSNDPGKSREPSLFSRQRPPVCRRQQADWSSALSAFSRKERLALWQRRKPAPIARSAGCLDLAGGRE